MINKASRMPNSCLHLCHEFTHKYHLCPFKQSLNDAYLQRIQKCKICFIAIEFLRAAAKLRRLNGINVSQIKLLLHALTFFFLKIS